MADTAPRAQAAALPAAGLSWRDGWRYGLPGLPLAFVALPMYVHLPHVYATQFGLPLATLGGVLLLARLFDALTDPWLGRFTDTLFARSHRQVLGVAAAAAALLWLGMALLFFPPWGVQADPSLLLWGLLACLLLTTTAYSQLSISHQSWGARLGGNELQRTRIVAWREGLGLLGVVLASVLPALLGWSVWLSVFGLSLAAGCGAWSRSTPPRPPEHSADTPQHQSSTASTPLWHPWRQPDFRRLMGVFICNGMASAMPATLVLFFIQDRLNAAAQEPLFLATYFVCAALSLPLWMRMVSRLGLAQAWLLGMGLSMAVFVWAATLSTGSIWGFWWVCALSGLALGSDLALPGALLAGVVQQHGDHGQREGAYFGWWNLATKLNLALAAGLALPLLAWLGYRPGQSTPEGLQALTVAYALLPCGLKMLAALGLYLGFVRNHAIPTTRPNQECP